MITFTSINVNGLEQMDPSIILDIMKIIEKYGNKHNALQKITVSCEINAPLYWWREFDIYKTCTTQNAYDAMNKFNYTIFANEFKLDDFSYEQLIDDEMFTYPLGGGWRGLNAFQLLRCTIEALNTARKRYLFTGDKKYWQQITNLLPSAYNQSYAILISYADLADIYNKRKIGNNILSEWDDFCDWVESLPCSELITNNNETMDTN